jgi:hypothetical protein
VHWQRDARGADLHTRKTQKKPDMNRHSPLFAELNCSPQDVALKGTADRTGRKTKHNIVTRRQKKHKRIFRYASTNTEKIKLEEKEQAPARELGSAALGGKLPGTPGAVGKKKHKRIFRYASTNTEKIKLEEKEQAPARELGSAALGGKLRGTPGAVGKKKHKTTVRAPTSGQHALESKYKHTCSKNARGQGVLLNGCSLGSWWQKIQSASTRVS